MLASKTIIKYNESNNDHTCLNNLTIPYTDKNETLNGLWDLLSEVSELKVPLMTELSDWVKVVESIVRINPEIDKTYDLNFVWGLNELLDFVGQKKSLTELNESIKVDGHNWLNRLYSLIVKIKEDFPLERNICLNQKNQFRKAEGISWDECNDDTLISISDLVGLTFANKLFSRKINVMHISSVEDFTLQGAINELKSKLDRLSGSDFNNAPYQECNAQFLKWLISKGKKEIIKDLKVLTGASKKNDESYVYDHFPKSEHLLLTPKSYFKTEFPLYSSLVRDKDCLNDIYDNFLNHEDYCVLNKYGFVHLNPLVVKKEYATIKLLESLIINEDDLNVLRDNEEQLNHKFITFSDFAYLTTTDGHIYGRNTTQKSSLERLRFLLAEAVEKDPLFGDDKQEIEIEGIEEPICLRQCLWIYRAKRLNWVIVKTETGGGRSETKYVSETPSSKNLSELLKGDETLTKTIRGEKQKDFLIKLGVGVSDLVRNTLPNDELRLSWDKVITNMIIARDVEPELVQEMFKDKNIIKEYKKKLNERRLINRNQSIGKLIEDLFKEYIKQLRESGISVNIERKPFGNDYILTEESSDLVNNDNERESFEINNWLVELKATGRGHAAMTRLQAETATEQKDNYALIVVPLDGTEPDIEYLRQNAKVVSNIGYKIDTVFTDFNEVELKKNNLNNEKNGISVNIEDQNIRFKVSATVWNSDQTNIEDFIKELFTEVNNSTSNTTT